MWITLGVTRGELVPSLGVKRHLKNNAKNFKKALAQKVSVPIMRIH